MLITSENSLESDIGLIWIQTVCHTDCIPEIFFLKKSANGKKQHAKLPSM